MINANVEVWLARSGQKSPFIAPEAYSEYLRCMRNPATVHAMCEDYRANATIDLEHDAADRDRKIACPFIVLWGEKGGLPRFDVLAEWRNFAANVRGKALPGTHWLAEQLPAETLAERARRRKPIYVCAACPASNEKLLITRLIASTP